MNLALILDTNPPPHSGWDTLIGIGIILLGVVFLVLLSSIIQHYFPSTRGFHSAGGNALMRLDATFLPGQRHHVVEAMEREDEEIDEQGDPPHTGQG